MSNWRTFELDIGEFVSHFGYQGEVTKASGDGGTDVIAKRGDRTVAIQCKMYQGSVGSKAVQLLLAAQRLYGATDFILITTGKFTKAALDMGRQADVRMIGGNEVLKVCRDKSLLLRSSTFLLTPGWTFSLEDNNYMVGRDSNCKIPLGDIHVSSRHAILTRRGLHLSVCDEGSTNGTKLNGQRLSPGKHHWLKYGDEIEFASVRCRLAMQKKEILTPPVLLNISGNGS